MGFDGVGDLQLGHNLLIVDRLLIALDCTNLRVLQLGHNLLIVDSRLGVKPYVMVFNPSIGPQSFDCGQTEYRDTDGRLYILQLGHNLLIVDSLSGERDVVGVYDLQLGHNLSIVDRRSTIGKAELS